MNRSLTNSEFFAYEGEVWCYASDGNAKKLLEKDTEIIDELLEHISTFYPKAYEALCSEYKGCSLNRPYFRFRMATRFVRCNFAPLDNIPDFSADCSCKFEFVNCPLRGECKYEKVVCRPEFDHKLSASELPVLKLWFECYSIDEIAEKLHLSPHTIHNHIRNAYQRLDVHSKSEFVRYASQTNLFS